MFRRPFHRIFSIHSQPPFYNSSIRTAKHRNVLEWYKLLLSGFVPVIIGIFTIVFSIQQHSIATKQRVQEQQSQLDAQRQSLFVAYIDEISHNLLSLSDYEKMQSKFLLHIRTKTLTVLRSLDVIRKKYIILFLYESQLLRHGGLDLSGADLTNAIFNRYHMNNAQFINSTLKLAVFAGAALDNSYFIRTTLVRANFSGTSLVRANFLSAEVVQGIDFTNADLLYARFTESQLRGQRATVVPHDFRHAQLPNGSFGPIDSKVNLVQNGDLETLINFGNVIETCGFRH